MSLKETRLQKEQLKALDGYWRKHDKKRKHFKEKAKAARIDVDERQTKNDEKA